MDLPCGGRANRVLTNSREARVDGGETLRCSTSLLFIADLIVDLDKGRPNWTNAVLSVKTS